ncbi:MAG: polysaccharide biosynthesis protein [Gammaproteobacteria bacterium]|nr:polysaccharide biosynthesis protein [Gammaproteobacteria bacterium]
MTLLILRQGVLPSDPRFTWLFLAAVILGIPILASQGLYLAIIRFVNAHMVIGALRAMVILTAVLTGMVGISGIETGLQLASFSLVFYVFGVFALVSSRFAMRAVVSDRGSASERVAIYGAGRAGLRLVAAAAGHHDLMPVLFIDDNPRLHGRTIAGLPVISPVRAAGTLALLRIDRVLLAMPSAGRRRRKTIIDSFSNQSVRLQTVPDIGDLLSGKARLEDIRDIDVNDLLGREIIPPHDNLLDACIRNKSVMVTGAGGSIGSELCRQIIELGPRRLVLFDVSEHALYQIDQELMNLVQSQHLDVEVVALLGSVHHRDRVRGAITAFGVQTLYHAAAYKHVPIVECNMVEGIHNNIIGTWHTAEAAEEAGVETFVLISTDKAVLPVNVMGATKRFAELVLQAMAERGSKTRFCMVRFGNVLESSGSVVPLFRKQIRDGGPVTVTHKDVIRYFMTIPEAAQLVIQAGSMGQGGDVFVLDMGEPVRIADLARRMINLMGFTVRDETNPEGDIAIRYTGLRNGEKLYEELLIGTDVTRTEHPMIMRAMEESLPWTKVRHFLAQLQLAGNAFDCQQTLNLLLESVNGFVPVSEGIDDLVWRARQADSGGEGRTALDPSASIGTVVDLESGRRA